MALKVARDGLGRFTDLAEIQRFSLLREEKQLIERFEQVRRRLVNGTKDGLPIVCKLSKKGAYGPSSLAVQPYNRGIRGQQIFNLDISKTNRK